MYRLPLGQWVNVGVDWLLKNYGHTFDLFSNGVKSFIDQFKTGLTVLPWWLILAVFVVIAWKVSGWRLAVGTGLGLILIFDLGLWPAFLDTLVLVIFSALVSIFIGVPLGILAARSNNFHRIFTPLLDFMQTMPSFVYLIPALMFFGLGTVPAIFATVIFAMPPVTRLTDLGIRQVPVELIEVGEAFGSTPRQMLWKIQLPIALPTIMAGINQTLMLSLSMVVISAMIGAEGFGAGVLQGISQMDIGKGFENGLAVVILAMVLDRMSQGIIKRGAAGAGKRRPRSLAKDSVDSVD
ncbi:ABC transporter permease [Acididesulfobacillus acetoxydans]|uniref:ABC transporter permease n=1 Tax=Acididesulfobacillus acetoxydans TaxID=1561005 RepID=UPI001F0D9312|nr:proline/glycine betaine ABC transporter permease [Acididesulfobacillus acetoxydans]